jgi:hypothetical protein
MEPWMPFEPGKDPGRRRGRLLGMLVRRVIVDDQMEIRPGRNFPVDLVEETNELLMPMAGDARSNGPALERSK